MATLLINTSLNITPIPYFSNNNHSVHNSNDIDTSIIKEALVNQYMITFNVGYNTRKNIWN